MKQVSPGNIHGFSSNMRIVRLMTGITGHVAHMFGGHHLRESFWFGGVFFVAAPAESGDIRQVGLDRAWVIGMLSLWPVAGLAGYVGVTAGGSDLGLFIMAADTSVLAGEGNGTLANHCERARAIVPILAERLGDDRLAQQQKDSHGGDENYHQPRQMERVSKKTAQECPLLLSG
jgi:hypothetical protein